MAHVLNALVGESSTTTGTGALTLDAALTGHRRFSAVCSVGDTVEYMIRHATDGSWEAGIGTYSSANTLTRTTLVESSTGSAVSFAAGDKVVIIFPLASGLGRADYLTSKTTPVDADSLGVADSAASGVRKKLTWANLKATLKTYFDTLYATVGQTFYIGTTSVAVNRASGALTLAGITLTTPDIGTPSAGNLSNCTADGTNAVGFRTIPQNSQSTAYTAVLADSGKHILHPSADTTARTMTIPANSSVAYPIGTALTFVNQASAGVMTIAITTDTMRLAGAGTTGSRTLAANGIATALKVTSTEWIISGTGLT